MTIPSQPDLLDFYTGHALQALISKSPLLSRHDLIKDGQIATTQEIHAAHVGACRAALAYGLKMLREREGLLKALEEREAERNAQTDEDFEAVKSCLRSAAEDGMEVEVITSALQSMRENPSQSVATVMADALFEWVK